MPLTLLHTFTFVTKLFFIFDNDQRCNHYLFALDNFLYLFTFFVYFLPKLWAWMGQSLDLKLNLIM